MAFDGLAILNIINELNTKIVGGRIDKIHQPEKDEIIIHVRNNRINHRLLLTANSVYPRIHLTKIEKENPMTAPLFTMVLRKHLSGGKITKVTQPNFDRIVNIFIESTNELGDLTEKQLIIEIMGRHSNIILIDAENKVLDSVKRISIDKSSVRPILPNIIYSLPPNTDRINPFEITADLFSNLFKDNEDKTIEQVIYQNHFGISPIVAREICHRAGVSNKETLISDNEIKLVYDCLQKVVNSQDDKNLIVTCKENDFFDFSFIDLTMFDNCTVMAFDSPSQTIETYYKERDLIFRVKQKTTDLRKIIENNIDRCKKKAKMYDRTLRKIENREELRLFGELITASIYSITTGDKVLVTQNFYDEDLPDVTITLDEELTPSENAQWYFKRYNKAKRTFDALQDQIIDNFNELSYLETVLSSIFTSENETDINEIRLELSNEGYLKKKQVKKGARRPSKPKPMRFISSDGFHIYVGKNNVQNDELTLKFANGGDIWLHTKDIPGSHVIIRTDNQQVPETTIVEAGHLAAYYSSSKDGSNVPVDYALKKHVHKPNGAKPGMVIYDNNKTLYITPDVELIQLLENKGK